MAELKNRKKLEPTSMALPAVSASSMVVADVMPLLPSAAGQSLWSRTRTGRTCHQIAPVLTRELSTTWLWLGVGTKMGALGGPDTLPSAISVLDRSTEEACMVQVPGTGLLGSGHCVVIAEFTLAFHASGTKPNMDINAWPSAVPQSSPGLPPLGHGMASAGFWSLSTENIGINT